MNISRSGKLPSLLRSSSAWGFVSVTRSMARREGQLRSRPVTATRSSVSGVPCAAPPRASAWAATVPMTPRLSASPKPPFTVSVASARPPSGAWTGSQAPYGASAASFSSTARSSARVASATVPVAARVPESGRSTPSRRRAGAPAGHAIPAASRAMPRKASRRDGVTLASMSAGAPRIVTLATEVAPFFTTRSPMENASRVSVTNGSRSPLRTRPTRSARGCPRC